MPSSRRRPGSTFLRRPTCLGDRYVPVTAAGRLGRYLILYRVGPDSIDILRVVHGACELAALRDDDDER
jgi:plasmid stabilization system protein ParE